MKSAHVLVVGGSRGLGRGFALLAAEAGWRVSTIARIAPTPTVGGFYAHDLADVAGIPRLLGRIVQECGPIRHLACFQRFRGDGDPWAGELTASLDATRCFLEASDAAFDPDERCSAVLVSSVNADYISAKLPCGYHVAKAGIVQLARYFAVALGAKGIRVNAVCPATFIKPENERFYAREHETHRRLAAASPLNRMGTWREVADAIFFLLSEQASFITGQALVVDGGISLRWHETLVG